MVDDNNGPSITTRYHHSVLACLPATLRLGVLALASIPSRIKCVCEYHLYVVAGHKANDGVCQRFE